MSETRNRKVLFVASVVKTHIMQFHLPYLRMFREMGWQTAVAAKNDYENREDCAIPFCDFFYDIPFERSPLNPSNIVAFAALRKVIDDGSYDIIHCHTPVGALLTRLAAIKARRQGTIVIYTAHGFHFYKGAPLQSWLLFYPVERALAHITDILITINKEDFRRAQRMAAKKTYYVPGIGFNLQKFLPIDDMKRIKLRMNLGIPDNCIVVLSVGEINKNKNHRIAIKALSRLNNRNVYYVICGSGPLIDRYSKLAISLGIGNQVVFTGYRENITDYYHIADIFVFPSLREGLPISLMEAMASSLPAVCSDIRGNRDLITPKRGGYLVNSNDVQRYTSAIQDLVEHPLKRMEMGEFNRKSVVYYCLENVRKLYEEIYHDAFRSDLLETESYDPDSL